MYYRLGRVFRENSVFTKPKPEHTAAAPSFEMNQLVESKNVWDYQLTTEVRHEHTINPSIMGRPVILTDERFLQEAQAIVRNTLSIKKDVWTGGVDVFDNFDIMHEFMHVAPLNFALMMCRLKMNRIKSRFLQTHPDDFARDPDLEDSVKDLACFAILALGIIQREKENYAKDQEA